VTARPALVGIAAMHALETDEVIALAQRVRTVVARRADRRRRPHRRRLPRAVLAPETAAVVVDDGERVLPRVCDALERGESADDGGGARAARADGSRRPHGGETGTLTLDDGTVARRVITSPRGAGSTPASPIARRGWSRPRAGCPFRCSFCSIWQLHARSVRERSIDAVCRDFASVGDHVFVADDLFWHHPSRSLELARELRPARRPQAVDSGAEPDRPWSRATPSCSTRGVRWRRTSTSSSVSRRPPTRGWTASTRMRPSTRASAASRWHGSTSGTG
jgi:radical SAM superfamily enzyme YgiQ (UPF0313 family)